MDYGIKTVSIAWTTPLDPWTSTNIIFTVCSLVVFICAPDVKSIVMVPPRVSTSPLVNWSDWTLAPLTTWYKRTASKVVIGTSANEFQSELESNNAWKASLVGANIVNGPFPDKVAIKSVVCLMSVKAATKLVNTSLFKALDAKLESSDRIDVITTHPNRYDTYKVKAEDVEKRGDNIRINRIRIPDHNSGRIGQIKSFKVFYTEALKIAKQENYDLVYASSSRLFTAFLGSKLARKHSAKLYLDIRDIFRESIVEIFKNKIFGPERNIQLKK